jgi:hypothetical protein
MMGEKKLSEIKAELRAAYAKLPGGPHAWFQREIKAARNDPRRDVKYLEEMYALFKDEAPKPGKQKVRKPKVRKPKARTPAKKR